MKKVYYFKEQGCEGFTSIEDKKELSEVIYHSYRLFILKEAANDVNNAFRKKNLVKEDAFCMGAFLYDKNDTLYFKKAPLDTRPRDWPRHVTILDEYKREIGVPVNDANRLEINRAFKRGYCYPADEKNCIILADSSFPEEDADKILKAFNVPESVDFTVKRMSAFDADEIDPKLFEE
ncbi:hypothetical protein FACS1894200_04670 [Spirochaetia bacterium]|nr:hypothetical protein FACS1894200_04670 [Spirochaetia bacterium]